MDNNPNDSPSHIPTAELQARAVALLSETLTRPPAEQVCRRLCSPNAEHSDAAWAIDCSLRSRRLVRAPD